MASSKVRFHKGLTTLFRQRLQFAGIAIDEEMAHRVLAGRPVVSPEVAALEVDVARLREQVLKVPERWEHQREWEQDNPGQRPFPPPFAERVLTFAREARTIAADGEGDPSMILDRIIQLCRAELGDDPYLPDFDDD